MKNIILIAFIGVFTLGSCKKDGCTDPTATNYDPKAKNEDGSCTYPPVIPPNYVCDGIGGNNSYYPLVIGLKRFYRTNYFGSNYDHTEEIIGDTVINGTSYYTASAYYQMSNNTSLKFYRADTNGDIYYINMFGVEEMIVSGNPAVGDSLESNKYISSINETIETDDCTYTGCVKVSTTGMLAYHMYFKAGVGMVKSDDYILEDATLQ